MWKAIAPILCIGCFVLGVTATAAHKPDEKPLVRELKGIKAMVSPRTGAREITDAKEWANIEKDLPEEFKNQVDFTREKVVGFGWAGSSSTSLSFAVRQCKGKLTVVVHINHPNPSLADYRLHGAWIVMPRDVTWEWGYRDVELP
jgi:hypothetical protein